MTRILAYACLSLSLGLLLVGYLLAGAFLPAGLLVLLGILWAIGMRRGWDWMPLLGLYAASLAAAAGFLFGANHALLVAGGLLALPTWDLSALAMRLRRAAPEDEVGGIERRHLLHLGVIMLAGVALSLLALRVRIHLSFEWTVALVFLAVWGIGRVLTLFLEKD